MAAEHRNDKTLRVLVGIADGAIRRELTSQLDDHGYDVVAALDDTTRILQIAAFVRPDLTLLDGSLDTIGGIALAGALRERSIAPSVVLLDQVTPQVVREGAQAGVAQILSKPLNPAALIPAVEIAAAQWRQEVHHTKRIQRLERSLCSRELVEEAKLALMDLHGIPERDAYRRIQRRAMDTRQPMFRIAQSILLAQPLPAAS